MDKTKFTGHKFKAHHDFWSSHQSSHAGGFSCKQNAAHGHSSYERREIAISGERASRLERLSKGKDMGYFILILSAVSLLFRKFTNDRHITIHTPCCKFEPAGQDVTIVPLLLKVPDQVSLKEYLNDVKFAVQQCYRYQELPVLNFESPLTDVYASDIYVSFHEIHTISQSEAQYDLTIEIQKWQGEFKLVASFRDGAFTDEFIRWWCEKFEVLADQINDLEQSTASLELLDDDEKQQLLSFGRNEKVFQQTFRRLQEILEHTARQHPHAIALVNEDEHISYDELNRRVGQLSKILKTKYQICSGDRVGILLDNKTDYILAILAVLTAGATYVPVDPLNPVKVIEFILKDASISLLISEDNFISKLTITGQTLIMSRERCDIMNTTSGAGDSHDVVDGAEQAYIIYTSGTSGKPKGVIVSHRGVINTLLGLAQWLPLSEGARFNFTTSFAFDASLKAIFLPLLRRGTLFIGGELHDVGGIAAHIHRDKINVMHATPTLWREVLKAEAQSLRSLCCISSGGEKLSAALASQLSGSLKQDVYNLYGPTETCINAAGYRVIGFDTDPPIGRPLPNVELYILDDDLNLMPMGAVGEICVSGVGLADGYIDDKLTSRRFVDNPYNNNFKLYRTGDLGRWTASGEIVYLGRKDAQVKINGYRLELAAVESTIRQIEGIDEVIVFTQSGSDNRDELVSYYTGRADRKLIRETLSEELPYYMIPSVIVKVAHVPMLPSGKVDRVALRNLASSGASGDLVLPTTPTQQMLVATLQALLQVEAISIHHDFFQIGGNSIKAIKLAHEIKKLWKVTIGLRDIFKFPVIEKLAEMIDLGTCEPAEPVFITALPAAEGYDLSYGQQRQWIVDQNPLEHKAYTMSGLLQIDGPLNSELVCRVFEILVHRHESLRTTFGFGHGRLQQRITPACDASFIMSKVDLQGSSDIDVVMTKTIQDLEDSGFDLQNGPLVKVLLFQLSPSSYRLFISLDHIISDGWSMQVLIREFMILYESLQHGRTSPLPNLEIHYKDFAHWQNQKLNDPAQLTQWKTFWTSEFSGALPVIDLPTSFVRPKQKSFKGAVVRSSFEGETFQRIKAYCRDKQITPYVFFLAALNHFLHRITGQTDLIVGTGASGRTHPVLQDQVGLYANIIPIRTRWMAWPDFDTLVLQTKHKVIECLHHQEYPFLKLLEDLDLSWEKNRSPLFDVMLMVQESSVEKFRIEGLQISEVDLPTQSSLFDMYFNIVEHHQAFDIFINYDTALFAKADAGYLHQEFIDVIVRAVDLSGQQYFSTSRKVQPRLNSAVIFNDHLQVTRPAEVGRVFIPVDAIHHNDAETFGVAVEINGTEYIETTMLGRYRFDGNLEILSANPDFLTADETWWSTREFESSICTLGHLRDCKLINQLVHGVRETVVHLASQHFTDDDILREKLAESLPLSVVKKLIFNDVPLLPYLPDGTVDIESLATMPLLSNRMASELNHVPEIDSSIEKVTVLAVNRALEPLPIHLQDVQSTHAIRIATDKPLTGSGGANMTNGDPAYVHGGILQKEGQACSLQEALIHIASAQPEKGIYIVDNANEDVFLSYPELLEQASSIAGGLRGAGLKPRSPVLLQFNRLQNIFSAFWGCLMGDFIPVIVARPDSFDKKGMVLDKVHSAWSLLKKPCIVTDEPDGVENMAQVYEDEAGLFVLDIRNLLEESNPYYLEKAAPHDVAFYQLTSGSTGASKCIPETHIAIIEHVLGAKSFNQLDASNISLNWMPMDHVGAILTYHIKSVYLGADQVQMRTELVLENPLLWLSYLDKYKVTHTWSPNFGYRLVVNALKENEHPKYDLSSMRHFLNGGEQVTMGVVKEFLELTEDFTLGRYCIQPAFGMAEVATAFIYNNSFSEQSILWIKNESLNDLLEIRSHEDEHCTSFIELGPPVPGVEIRITDEENRVLPERKIGRFQIRGNSVMPGYLNNEKANAESFVGDGWFNSGDLGFIHNGKLTITGREKEMIIIRGNNFYCFEIEDFVGKIEGVTPTYVAACSLKQESSDTEGFTIFYVPSSENEFLDFELMERIRLAVAFNFKINPEYVIPCDKTSFPKTTSGKIQRARLQKIFHDGGFNDIVKQIDLKFRNEKTILPNWFYEKVWIRKNLPCTPRRIDGKTLLLFLNDDQQIRWWRTKYALDAVFVKPAQAFSREAADVFAVRPACKDDYIVMFGQLQASVKFVTHIVHAWNFNEVENSFAEMILEKDFDRGIFSVLNCLQAQSLSHETKFLVVTSGGMAVRSTDQLHAGKGTLPGFIKSAARESSQIKFCQLDISYPDAAWPEKVYHELFNPHQDGEVAYRQEKRYISRLRQYVPTSHQHEHPIRFDRGGLYLIAGGLGRIGQKIAAHLIGKFNARLLLVGCTDIHQQSDDPKIIARRKAYDALKKLSPDVAYESIDLRDTQNLCSWIEKMEMQKNTKLSGILHVAGVVEDIDIHLQDINKNLFVNLSREDVLKMYQAKVFGTCSLLRLMPARPQAMFVTFSSALSYFGGASASAYASAGSFQDALMLNYKKHYPNIQTINWTQWNTSGVADAGSELIQQKGFVAISHQQALKSLTVSLNSGKAQMLVGPDLKNEQILSEIDGAAIKKELRVYYTSKNHSSDETREQLSAIVATYQPASGRRFELQIIEEQNLPVDERDRVIKVDLYLKRNLQSSSKAIHPQTAIQKVISAIWRSVLGLEQLDITTSFFAVGGDSLKATQILARIRQNLHVQIELKDIFENPSILKLSHVIENAAAMGETIRRAGEKDHYEVSHAQKRLWIAAQTDRNDTSYNIFGAYGMEGDLDVSVLEKSLTAFIRRHEITRTNIITVNGEPRQIIRDWESRAFKVEVVDIECEAEIGKYCQIEFEQQFNLEKDLLLKAKLLRSNSRKHFLLFTMHHIISDAWSLTILAKEVITLYESFKNNVPMLPLQPLAIQYKDYAEWHNAQLRNGALQTHREYWSRRFKDKIPSMDFPTDFERPAERTLNGDSVYGKIDQPLFGELKLQSTRYETSIFTMMIAAVSSLFYRYTGQGDIVFKTPVSGRTEKAMEDQIGFYINTLPLYTRIREGMTFTELLAEVKRETVESFTHQTYPIDDLIEYFKIKKIDGRSPLSDIVILYLNSSSHSDPLDKMVDVKISEVDLNTRINKFDLRIVFGETPEALNVKIDYNIDLYKKATIELLLSRLTRIVEVFTRNPIERIDQIEFTIDNSRQTIVEQGEYAQAFSGFNFN